MLDINFIKQNKELVETAIKNKKYSDVVDLQKILDSHDAYVHILKKVETHRGLRNALSDSISKVPTEKRAALIEEASQVKQELVKMETDLETAKQKVDSLLLLVPNVYDDSVPIGVDDTENVVARSWGTPKEFSFTPRDHVALGELLDIIDIETAGKISGSRFFYLKNEAVLLEFAIVQFVLTTLMSRTTINEVATKVGNPSDTPFVPVIPPLFIKSDVMKKMDRLDPIEERYFFEKDDLVLVGSAEHTLGPLHMNQNLSLKELPIRYIGFSPAFRREAGSYGKDVKGIIRTHHFDKLEMESFSSVEMGKVEQDLIVGLQEYMLQKLEIPYQVVSICTGDMGKPDFRQVDMECFVPSQKVYRETHTSDYMTDFQSRRLNTTYTDAAGDRKFVHMNDATAFAIGRILVAILENNQQEDGSVVIPEVLRSYTGIDKISPKK